MKELSATERDAIAFQIRQMRQLEQDEKYAIKDWTRDIHEYLYYFNGLSRIFDYARNLNEQRRVLDIGAGTTKGISEIAKRPLGKGLNFEATVLTRHSEIEDKLGFEKTHITSAETLKGI